MGSSSMDVSPLPDKQLDALNPKIGKKEKHSQSNGLHQYQQTGQNTQTITTSTKIMNIRNLRADTKVKTVNTMHKATI